MQNPTYGYRRAEDGSVEAQIFDGEIPEGWCDSPARVDDKAEAKPAAPKAASKKAAV